MEGSGNLESEKDKKPITGCEEMTKENNVPGNQFSGPRRAVLCGKVSQSLSDWVHDLVKDRKYRTINDFVEEAILEKAMKEITEGGC